MGVGSEGLDWSGGVEIEVCSADEQRSQTAGFVPRGPRPGTRPSLRSWAASARTARPGPPRAKGSSRGRSRRSGGSGGGEARGTRGARQARKVPWVRFAVSRVVPLRYYTHPEESPHAPRVVHLHESFSMAPAFAAASSSAAARGVARRENSVTGDGWTLRLSPYDRQHVCCLTISANTSALL